MEQEHKSHKEYLGEEQIPYVAPERGELPAQLDLQAEAWTPTKRGEGPVDEMAATASVFVCTRRITRRRREHREVHVINRRAVRNLDEIRRAIAAFVERYNAKWLVEKLGFVSPFRIRDDFTLRSAA